MSCYLIPKPPTPCKAQIRPWNCSRKHRASTAPEQTAMGKPTRNMHQQGRACKQKQSREHTHTYTGVGAPGVVTVSASLTPTLCLRDGGVRVTSMRLGFSSPFWGAGEGAGDMNLHGRDDGAARGERRYGTR